MLGWLQDGGGFEEPALRALMLTHVAASWSRLARPDRASQAIERALTCATQIGDSGERHRKLAEIAAEVAAAGMPALARRMAEEIPAGSARDEALCGVALALVGAGSYADAVAALRAAQDRSHPAGRVTEIAERLAEAGEHDLALACAREASLDQWVPYIAATAARRLAIAQRTAEARAMLLLAADDTAVDVFRIRALCLARRAQALALLGQAPEALVCAEAALDLSWSTSGAFICAWCADALARIGEQARAAKAAERALLGVQDLDDDWTRATHFEIAAGGLVEAGTLDTDRILAMVRAITDEYARAEALSGLYPHFRRAVPDEVPALCVAIGEIKDGWAQARAVAALAEHMMKSADQPGLHQLLGIAKSIDNKWAGAHALGRLASALAVCGDPDDLTRALEPMTGFQLPGWRRAAALAMAAGALRRTGSPRRAADLVDEALDVALLEEDLGLTQRVRHARQCGIAALHLGNRLEAERQADVAQSSAARIRPARYGRSELLDLLFDLAGELGTPERVERIMDLCGEGEDRSVELRAAGVAGIALARLGRCEPALAYIARALEGVAAQDAATTAVVHSAAACAWHLCGNPDRAGEHLATSLKIACTERALLADVLNDNLEFLTAIDAGATLARVFEGLHEVDLWWQA